jgi:MFS family permease
MLFFLARERIIASPGFNRWLIPPAALCIHLCIGQAYAFSVFKLPMTRLIGGATSGAGDWSQTDIAWVFTIAIFFLGLSAAVFGRWVERVGPRASGFTSALCWGAGFMLSALAVRTHTLWLLYAGYGVIGGCGLGLGYITPVSTLIKWFPDRRGLATGMAIMGFGGGAMIAGPLSQQLMSSFAAMSPGGGAAASVASTLACLGSVYLAVMLVGAFSFRLPPSTETAGAAGSGAFVPVDRAWRTGQFRLLWAVLLLNVTAGIGILEQASPMIQEMFSGKVGPAAAAGFVGLLSLFNMAGRFFWSGVSDRIGRRRTYAVIFVAGAALYLLLPVAGHLGSVGIFVLLAALLLTLYGGGFATIPAYLADLFGTGNVGAIHGRLLTAWSCAGIAGPLLVNLLRESRLAAGVPAARAYDLTLILMAGLLAAGFCCNLAVRPVPQLAFTGAPAPAAASPTATSLPREASPPSGKATWLVVVFWAAVLLPLCWGVAQSVLKAAQLFS